MQGKKQTATLKKELLNKVIGEVIKEKRAVKNKGILLLAYEYDLSTSSLIQTEKGKRDPQISTLWKIANALDMKFSSFILEVESRLPEDFKLIDD